VGACARDIITPNAWPDLRRFFAQSGGADGAGDRTDRPPSDLSFHFVLLWLFRRTVFAEQVIHHKNLTQNVFNDQGAPLSHEVAVRMEE
jgi:hypothetical protein